MDGSSSDQPTLQRRSSQVSYATVNGITLPNYSHISTKPKKASKSESSEDNLSDEEALAENDANLCAPRNVVTDQLLFWVFQKCLFLAFLGIIMDVNSAVLSWEAHSNSFLIQQHASNQKKCPSYPFSMVY